MEIMLQAKFLQSALLEINLNSNANLIMKYKSRKNDNEN